MTITVPDLKGFMYYFSHFTRLKKIFLFSICVAQALMAGESDGNAILNIPGRVRWPLPLPKSFVLLND